MIPAEVWVAAPWGVMADPKISSNAKVCYVLLVQHARPFDGKMVVWPSQERLAQGMGMSVRTVQEAMKELTDKGLIVRHRRMNKTSLTYLLPVKDAHLTEPPEWLVEDDEPSRSGVCDGAAAECASVTQPDVRGSKTKEVEGASVARRTSKSSRPVSFEDEAYMADHKPTSTQKPWSTKEFKREANAFMDQYNFAADKAGWAQCSVMTAYRRKMYYQRLEDGSLGNIEQVFKGMIEKGKAGMIRDVEYLLRNPEAGISLREYAVVSGSGKIKIHAPLVRAKK